MLDEDIIHLREMLEEAYICRQFISQRTRSDLDDDLLLYYAVTKVVELIGEAAWQIDDSTHTEIPEIDWHGIIGMRHRLVHGFQKVIRDRIWNAAEHGVPILIPQLQAVLEQHGG